MALFLIPGKSGLVEPEEEETWVTLREKAVTQYGSWQRVDRTAGRLTPSLAVTSLCSCVHKGELCSCGAKKVASNFCLSVIFSLLIRVHYWVRVLEIFGKM